jgi:hypothetical protein
MVKASHWMKKHGCFLLSIFILWHSSYYPETEYFAVIPDKVLEHQKMSIIVTVYQTSGSTYTWIAKTKLILPNIKYLHRLCKYFSMTPNLFYDAQRLSQRTGPETTFYVNADNFNVLKVCSNEWKPFNFFSHFNKLSVQGAISTILCSSNLNGSTFHVTKNTNALCFTASHAQNHDKQNNRLRNLASKCSKQHETNKQNTETWKYKMFQLKTKPMFILLTALIITVTA